MARRATLDRDEQSAVHDETLAGVPIPARKGRQAAVPWRGAGGRWAIWVLRAVAWAALLLIAFRGVAAIMTKPAAAPPAGAAAAAGPTFPVSLAKSYAQEFGAVYLNFNPATAGQRAAELSAFLPTGTDPQLGWNGAGTERLQSEQVAAISVQNDHSAIVTLLAQVSDSLIELAVPIYSADGGMVVSGEPALLPAPARIAPPQPASQQADSVTAAALTAELPGFFQAYASGDQVTLSRYLAKGTQVTGLNGAFAFGSIQNVTVPFGGSARNITVTVLWHQATGAASPASGQAVGAAPGGLEMTYQMTVVRQGTSWYVQAIGASTQAQSGPP
ncbi:MAG: conjugal transfer protein [Streptosporangiaceae bacterium]